MNANSFAQYWKGRGRSYTPLSNVSYLTNNGNFKVLLYDKCNIGDVLAIAHDNEEVHHMMFISGKQCISGVYHLLVCGHTNERKVLKFLIYFLV
ncbi:amidase domain-containing protein [Clostridium estertheticum]|uniref:amidase domain-containing protein n=1 Tax=Clostridium estertheticum TaxID=238834 RepID=UPI001C0CABE9|nr:amidase domain-containing protein [Clostridium estertheticum]WAG67997.1 amidase domain-containing protein [Clostridium estertheticum]